MPNPILYNPAVNDPYTQVYAAILASLQAWPPLTALVGPGNFTDASNIQITTFKDLLTSADTNAIQLLQGASKESPFGSNNMVCDVWQDYSLLIATDSLSIIPLNQVKYEVLRALVNKAGYNFNLPFVISYDLANGSDSTMVPLDQIQSSKRWAHVKTVTVKMKFTLQSLR